MKRYVTLLLAAVVGAVAVPAQGAPAAKLPEGVPRNGLVAFWTADGHAKDSAGKNHGAIREKSHGSTGKGVTFTTGRHGKAKGAFAFDGKGGSVKIPDKPELDTDKTFTLAAWINPSAYTDQHGNSTGIAVKWYKPLTHGDYSFHVVRDGRLGLSVCAGPRAYESHYSKSVVPKSTWTHVAVTFNAGTVKLYINGRLDVTKVSTKVRQLDPAEYMTDDLHIGALYNNANSFNGAIDEVGIWNRALGGGEIAALAGVATEPPPAHLPRKDLVAFWSGDGDARDSAGKNHGTVGPGVAFTGDRHGKAKGAFLFDGKSGFVTVPDSAALDTDFAFTLSAWVNPTAYKDKNGNRGWIISKWHTGDTHGDYALAVTSVGQVEFLLAEDYPGKKYHHFTSREIVPLNTWTHVAATFDRGVMKLYINGGLGAGMVSTTVKRTDPDEYVHDDVTIGGLWNNGYNFTGAIDDVGIWGRALTPDEIAAVAGPMAGMHVVRLAGVDRIEMNDSSILKGTIQNKQYTVATPFGKLVIPATKVVGMLPGPKPKTATTRPGSPQATQPVSQPAKTGPFVHLILADGQVVTGQLSAREILLATDWRPALKIPIGKIRQCGFGISKAKPAEPISSGPMVTLRGRQRLGIATASLQFQTDWGKVDLPIKSLLRIEPADWQSARHKAILANGSVLTGTLAAKLKLKLALGPELTVEPGQVWSITGTAKGVKAAGATMLLRGGDRLIGRFAGKMLTIKTVSGDVKVHAGGIASMQFDAKKPTSVTLSTWDNKTVKGTLTDALVAFEITPGGPVLKIPAARIANVTQPDASPPAEMLEKIEKLIAQLGAESYVDREKAQKALIAMGKSIVPILKKHLSNRDPEIRQRLQQIIKALGG